MASTSQGRTLRQPKTQMIFRTDVQGLRALAVVAVILDHLFGWPVGGFVGVDVFFVISGFVITGTLLRDHERTGTISFLSFYKRRIKRILPASVLVLLVTVIAAFLLYSTSRFQQTLADAWSAFFFVGNWRFAAAGTDYFAASGPVSPLQHFWSLAVEEQFYFVWPWIMIAIFALSARSIHISRIDARRAVGMAMIVLVVASLTWALWESTSNPSVAYFSTFSRAWELGVGALIAVFSRHCSRIPTALRTILGWVGLIMIVVSFFTVSEGGGFPAPWALFPVLATALVILAGTGGSQPYLWPITNPVANWLGDTSFSLYLWHFPVIILLEVLITPPDPQYYILAVLLTGALATASFYGVEQPIRGSSWLSGLSKTERWNLRRRRQQTHVLRSTSFKLLALVLVVTTTLVGLAVTKPGPEESNEALSASDIEELFNPSSPTPQPSAELALTGEIRSALAAKNWPDLTPTLNDAIGGPQAPSDIALCAGEGRPSNTECSWGSISATKTAVIVGDSTAVAYVQAFKSIAESGQDWRVESLATFGCPFVDINSWTSNLGEGVCTEMKRAAVERINELQPDLVIVTNTYEPRNSRDTNDLVSVPDWATGVGRIIESIKDSAGNVAVLAPPPSDVNIQDCYTRISSPADCVSEVTSRWTDTARAESNMAQGLGGTFVDSSAWFCIDRKCPAFVGGVPVKLDLVHITADYAKKIAPDIQAAFQTAGLF